MKYNVQELLKELLSYTEIPQDYSSLEALNIRTIMCQEFEKLVSSDDKDKQKKMITLLMGGIILTLKTDDMKYKTTHYSHRSITGVLKNIKPGATNLEVMREIGSMALANLPGTFNARIFQKTFRLVTQDRAQEVYFFPNLNLHPDKVTLLVDFCRYYPNLEQTEVDSDALEALKKQHEAEKEMQERAQKEKELEEKAKTIRSEIHSAVKYFGTTLSDKDEEALKTDRNINPSQYLDGCVLSRLPELCKEENKVLTLVECGCNGYISAHVLEQALLNVSEEKRVEYIMTHTVGFPLPSATKNEPVLKVLDSVLSQSLHKYPKFIPSAWQTLRSAFLVPNIPGDSMNLLLDMANKLSHSVDVEKQRLSDKTHPFTGMEEFHGIGSLFEFYLNIAEEYVASGEVNNFAKMCCYLSYIITAEEYDSFKKSVFKNLDKSTVAMRAATSKIFDQWEELINKMAAKAAAKEKAAAAEKAAAEEKAAAAEKAAAEAKAAAAEKAAAEEKAAAAEKAAAEAKAAAAEKAEAEAKAAAAAKAVAEEKAAAAEKAEAEAKAAAAAKAVAEEKASAAAQAEAKEKAAATAQAEAEAKVAPAAKAAAVENSADILCEIIDQLIDNITKGTNRCTSGQGSSKVTQFEALRERIRRADPALKDDMYHQYLSDIKTICEQKRNPFHFWKTPESVREYEDLLKQYKIEPLASPTPDSN